MGIRLCINIEFLLKIELEKREKSFYKNFHNNTICIPILMSIRKSSVVQRDTYKVCFET